MKETFNVIDKKIMRVLYQQKIELTIYNVAKECSISYPTAKTYLKKLAKGEVIKEISKQGSPKKYKFNFDVFRGEKPKVRGDKFPRFGK